MESNEVLLTEELYETIVEKLVSEIVELKRQKGEAISKIDITIINVSISSPSINTLSYIYTFFNQLLYFIYKNTYCNIFYHKIIKQPIHTGKDLRYMTYCHNKKDTF